MVRRAVEKHCRWESAAGEATGNFPVRLESARRPRQARTSFHSQVKGWRQLLPPPPCVSRRVRGLRRPHIKLTRREPPVPIGTAVVRSVNAAPAPPHVRSRQSPCHLHMGWPNTYEYRAVRRVPGRWVRRTLTHNGRIQRNLLPAALRISERQALKVLRIFS